MRLPDPLFTQVRGRRILRTSPRGGSANFALYVFLGKRIAERQGGGAKRQNPKKTMPCTPPKNALRV